MDSTPSMVQLIIGSAAFSSALTMAIQEIVKAWSSRKGKNIDDSIAFRKDLIAGYELVLNESRALREENRRLEEAVDEWRERCENMENQLKTEKARKPPSRKGYR